MKKTSVSIRIETARRMFGMCMCRRAHFEKFFGRMLLLQLWRCFPGDILSLPLIFLKGEYSCKTRMRRKDAVISPEPWDFSLQM